jgi:hypothetical protein
VVCEFNLSTAEVYGTGETEWNARYGYEPMVWAFYCKELASFTTEELVEFLVDVERARTLGFDPDQFAPARSRRAEPGSGVRGVIAFPSSPNRSSNVC